MRLSCSLAGVALLLRPPAARSAFSPSPFLPPLLDFENGTAVETAGAATVAVSTCPPPPAPVQSDRMKWEKRRCMGVGAGLTVPATGGSVGRSTGGGVGAGPDHTPWDGAGNVALPPLPYDDACPPPLPHHVGRPFHLEQGAPAAY